MEWGWWAGPYWALLGRIGLYWAVWGPNTGGRGTFGGTLGRGTFQLGPMGAPITPPKNNAKPMIYDLKVPERYGLGKVWVKYG